MLITAQRRRSAFVSAVCRRGLRLLGPDAQHFSCRGRGPSCSRPMVRLLQRRRAEASAARMDPYDVESLAMALARKACGHLVVVIGGVRGRMGGGSLRRTQLTISWRCGGRGLWLSAGWLAPSARAG